VGWLLLLAPLEGVPLGSSTVPPLLLLSCPFCHATIFTLSCDTLQPMLLPSFPSICFSLMCNSTRSGLDTSPKWVFWSVV